VLQVVTQVQEMTLTFVPKLIAVVLVCVITGSWMMAVTVDLAKRFFEYAGTL
jgi:flagellar biosynthetic protein FliQ